jgi:hypothetical protein
VLRSRCNGATTGLWFRAGAANPVLPRCSLSLSLSLSLLAARRCTPVHSLRRAATSPQNPRASPPQTPRPGAGTVIGTAMPRAHFFCVFEATQFLTPMMSAVYNLQPAEQRAARSACCVFPQPHQPPPAAPSRAAGCCCCSDSDSDGHCHCPPSPQPQPQPQQPQQPQQPVAASSQQPHAPYPSPQPAARSPQPAARSPQGPRALRPWPQRRGPRAGKSGERGGGGRKAHRPAPGLKSLYFLSTHRQTRLEPPPRPRPPPFVRGPGAGAGEPADIAGRTRPTRPLQ